MSLVGLVCGKRHFGGPCDGQWRIRTEGVQYVMPPPYHPWTDTQFRAICPCGWSSDLYQVEQQAEFAGYSHAKGRRSLVGMPPLSATLGKDRRKTRPPTRGAIHGGASKHGGESSAGLSRP